MVTFLSLCITVHQDNLDETVLAWNSHRIRPSANERVPHGRPLVMYNFPALYGVQDFKHIVDEAEIEVCSQECANRRCPCDETVYELCEMYVIDLQLTQPTNADEARELYEVLRDRIRDDVSVL